MSTTARDEKSVALSQAFRLMVGAGGCQVPAYDRHDPLVLDYAGVCLVQRLADARQAARSDLVQGACAQAGTPEAAGAVTQLCDELEQRGLLIDAAQAVADVSPDPVTPQAFSALGHELPDMLVVNGPTMLSVSGRGFEAFGHDGELMARFNTEELMAFTAFARPLAWADAWQAHVQDCGGHALDENTFRLLATRLHAAGFLVSWSAEDEARARASDTGEVLASHSRVIDEAIAADVEQHEAAEKARVASGERPRVRVVPVMAYWLMPPVALGMLVASARAWQGGRLQAHYHFVPDWEARWPRLERYLDEPGVFLYSNYLWSHQNNLTFSKWIKQGNPRSINVHGGPDAPRYPRDVETYFRDNPHVDVVVHGEGEATLCDLLAALADRFDGEGPVDLSPLKHVPGLTFRLGEEIIRTAPREQIADLDSVPSPYLEGLFGAYENAATSVTLETNRGCPYGCTFCDWGSATLSKVRKFSLERIFAELEWCARNRVPSVGLADANFGMLARDVEIAEKVAELKREYGFPRAFGTNFAKNKIKYLKQIVSVLVKEGIITQGLLSLQSLDEQTLDVIDRSNIKTEKYDELAGQFREAGLPLAVDLMLGLPGATPQSFRNDLQGCIDREVTANIFPTQVLVNSPMNDPEYRKQHRIETGLLDGQGRRSWTDNGLGNAVVVSTATFTRDDYDQMLDLRRVFRLFENLGVMRQVSRFVRQETGIHEVDFIEHLRREVRACPETWPNLAFTLRGVPEIMVPPVSWSLLIGEVRRFLLEYYTIADDSALDTVLAVQHALLPSQGRQFPYRIALAHDYVAWHQAMVAAKDRGEREQWHQRVPRLHTYGPGTLEITDPNQVCTTALGSPLGMEFHGDWELSSPVSRVMPARHLQLEESA